MLWGMLDFLGKTAVAELPAGFPVGSRVPAFMSWGGLGDAAIFESWK